MAWCRLRPARMRTPAGRFTYGGWGQGYHDDVAMQDFAAGWGRATDGNPFRDHMNAARKYVVSRTLDDVDAWPNSVLLRGEARRWPT